MTTTTGYSMKASAKAKQIGERFKNRLPDEVNQQVGPVPFFENDYANRINTVKNSRQSNGIDAIIDVQPDFRNIILTLNYYVTNAYNDIQYRSEPSLTPSSLTGYSLALIYAYALLNDDENVRDTQSDYARDFTTTYNLDRIKSVLRNLKVPSFIRQLLEGLAPSKDERRQNLKFVYSLAAFDLKYDYGRTPPVSIFFHAHNLIATEAANQAPTAITEKWMATSIIAQPMNLTVGNYLGYGHIANYRNWFLQSCTALFNPVTLRFNTVRPVLMQIPSEVQTFNCTDDVVNPYIHLLSFDTDNQSTMEKLLEDLSTTILRVDTQSCLLGDIGHTAKGNQLIPHYYEPYCFPTFHSQPYAVVTDTKLQSILTSEKILQARTRKLTEPVAYPVKNDLFYEQIYLASGKDYVKLEDPDVVKIFDKTIDIDNDVRHLCPFETSKKAIAFNIMLGKCIQSEELDSVSVPQPNPRNSILKENSFIFESAVPFTHIHPQTRGDVFLFERVKHDPTEVNTRVDLYNRSIDRIPGFINERVNDAEYGLPGFDRTLNITNTERGSNTIGFTINEDNTPTQFNSGLRKIYAWSSYRHINTRQTDTVTM